MEDAIASLHADARLSAQTIARLEALMRQFASFVERGHGITSIVNVDAEIVHAYITAPTGGGAEPGISLQHFRRLAVRVLFRSCRRSGVAVGDPTADASLPSRRRATFRPLDDDELMLCRAAAVASRPGVRVAAAWALCEATARTGELPHIRHCDLDLEAGRVWIAGTVRTLPRWGRLTEWGAARLAQVARTNSESPIVVHRRDDAALAQSSAVGVISRTLTHAGLGDAADVRPSSVVAWAGRRIFNETGRIDLVAARLGMRSLDRTAAFIGWDWSRDGE